MPSISASRPDFQSALLKLDRAKAHITDFRTAAAAYMAGNPYSVWPELDPVTKRYGYMIADNRRIPVELALIAGDAIHNMRSALDHLIAACCVWNGRDHTRAYFPIVRQRSALEKAIRHKVSGPGAGDVAVTLIRQTKPYKRGNGPLFAMHCLDIADKHQLTLAVKTTLDVSVAVEGNESTILRQPFRSASGKRRFVPVPVGMEDRLVPAEISITSDIVFGRKLARAGKPCIGELEAFLIATQRVAELFAAAF